MKKYSKNIGLILIIIGTILLVATQFALLSTNNYLLLCGLFSNILGAFLIVRSIKGDSLY